MPVCPSLRFGLLKAACQLEFPVVAAFDGPLRCVQWWHEDTLSDWEEKCKIRDNVAPQRISRSSGFRIEFLFRGLGDFGHRPALVIDGVLVFFLQLAEQCARLVLLALLPEC